MDIFHEETVTPSDIVRAQSAYRRVRVISWMFLVTGIIFSLLFYVMLSAPIPEEARLLDVFLYNLLPILIMAAVSFFFYVFFRRKKHKYLVDFDYTFVSGELRIARVLNGIKRRGLAKISTSDISVIGRAEGDKYLRYKTMPGIKKIVATPNEGEDSVYFAFCTVNGQRSLLLFEPSETLIAAIKRFSGRMIEWQ